MGKKLRKAVAARAEEPAVSEGAELPERWSVKRKMELVLLPLVREPPFFDEVLGQLEPHRQLPIFARASVSSHSSGSARVLRPRVPVSRNTRFLHDRRRVPVREPIGGRARGTAWSPK
jgi:hypothetical protein